MLCSLCCPLHGRSFVKSIFIHLDDYRFLFGGIITAIGKLHDVMIAMNYFG